MKHEANLNELDIIRTAMEFVIANRMNANLHQNSEYCEMANACERELTRRATHARENSKKQSAA